MSKNIVNSLVELIGNTPMLYPVNIIKDNNINAKLFLKLESFNPGGSVKDRIGYAMINDAEEKGLINKDTTIIEPTSGNTGIALAYIAAAKRYHLILTMPDSMSIERRSLLKQLGAEIVLTPGSAGMKGAINKAVELSETIENSYLPQQFINPSNPMIHNKTTAEEIWRDTEGNIDIFIAGVGTGGTITGVGQKLKQKNPNIKIVAIEPDDSAVISGDKPGPHKIQGIGAGFIPENYNNEYVDEIVRVKNIDAINTSRMLAKTEGLLVGISSGAAAWVGIQLAKKEENKGKTIVTILPDTGERYISTDLFEK